MTVGGWKYAASSVIGTSHLSKPDGVCQDSHTCRYLDGPASVMVMVVSDGAGSASQSQHGSLCACQYIEYLIAQTPPDTLFTCELAITALRGLRRRLTELADEAQIALREFACTLLVAIADRERAAFWQIGDGAMCFRLRDEETYQYAFWPEKGDYANVTFFVTDPNAEEHLEFDAMEGEIIELASFSDGLERLALDFVTGEVHPGFFNGLFPHLRALKPGYSTEISSQLGTFLASERVNKRTDDDKTLILASRLE
jgi:hypothetical protein